MPGDTDPQSTATRMLDRLERSILDAAAEAGVEVRHFDSPVHPDDYRASGAVLFSRTVGDTERIHLYRWDHLGVLLGARIHASNADGRRDWVYLVHLSRNRCREVEGETRTDGDGKNYGDHDWILRNVTAWILDLRDLWSEPLPFPPGWE